MSTFVLDRLTSGLVKQGSGPVPTGMTLVVIERIDAAGEVILSMPATDSRASAFTANTLHYVRGNIDGDVGDFRRYGIIKQREKSTDGMTLNLKGPNLLGELLHTHVGTLELSNGSGGAMAAASVLPAIMAYAPSASPAWSTSGTPSKNVYYQFGDESILQALIKVAELTGDHFRLSRATARRVTWLPTTSSGFDASASGLRAVDSGDPAALEDNDDVCLIVGGLQELADGYQRITRLYPRGAGNADARLYLNGATEFGATVVPANTPGDYVDGAYTLHIDADPAQSYIKHTTSEQTGGVFDATKVIGTVETFRDIAALDTTSTDDASASNQLAATARIRLQRRLEEQRSYRLTLTKVRQPLPVGTTLNVIVRHFVDGYGWVNINDHAMVLETQTTWTADGGDAEVIVEVTV